MTTTKYYLGVDIGSTKSHALIIQDDGEAVGFGVAGAGNHETVGVDGFQKALHTAVNGAIENAQIQKNQIAGAGYGIAGYDWPSDMTLMNRVIDSLGLNAPYEVVNDAMMGLIAGAKQGWGVSVTAGTSSNCRGRNQQGQQGRVTGNGTTFGEYGGGSELVSRALSDVARAWSLMGPPTLLSELFVQSTGSKDVDDLLEGIPRGRYRVQATDAPLVFEAARRGDEVARNAIIWISKGLADLAIGVIRQIGIQDQEFEVVLAGSFYKGSPLIRETMRECIREIAPRAQLVRLEAPPVVGPALLGMEAAGVDFTLYREQVIKSTNQLVDPETLVTPD